MTLDEAIKHCLEVAEENELAAGTYEILAENNHNAYEKLTAETNSSRCAECAADHRQLAEWLTELKELRRLVDLVAKYAGNSEDICERYLPSINGDLCVTDGMGASNCTCCGYEYRCDYKTDIGLLEDVETSTNTDVQPVDRWISVMDRLPENGNDVLVYDTDCGIVIGWYDKEIGDFAADFISPLDAVTHWIPLPEPPKDGDING